MARATFDYLSYNSLNYRTLPFKAHISVTASHLDHAMSLTGDYEVGLGADGAAIVGKLDYLDAGTVYCTVGIGDTLILPGVSGSLPSEGDYVVANGSGLVRAGTSADAGYAGKRNTVLGVDSATYSVVVLF